MVGKECERCCQGCKGREAKEECERRVSRQLEKGENKKKYREGKEV